MLPLQARVAYHQGRWECRPLQASHLRQMRVSTNPGVKSSLVQRTDDSQLDNETGLVPLLQQAIT